MTKNTALLGGLLLVGGWLFFASRAKADSVSSSSAYAREYASLPPQLKSNVDYEMTQEKDPAMIRRIGDAMFAYPAIQKALYLRSIAVSEAGYRAQLALS